MRRKLPRVVKKRRNKVSRNRKRRKRLALQQLKEETLRSTRLKEVARRLSAQLLDFRITESI